MKEAPPHITPYTRRALFYLSRFLNCIVIRGRYTAEIKPMKYTRMDGIYIERYFSSRKLTSNHYYISAFHNSHSHCCILLFFNFLACSPPALRAWHDREAIFQFHLFFVRIFVKSKLNFHYFAMKYLFSPK